MCPPPASGKGGRPMTRTREISGSGQIFALLVLSQCFWLLCCRPSLVNGLLSMAASAVDFGVVCLLAIFCRRCAARGETPLSPVFAAWGALLAVGYFAVTAEQLLSAARVLFEGVFSPLLLLLVLLAAAAIGLVGSILASLLAREDLGELLATLLVSMGLGLMIADIMLPVVYQLGPERARPWMYVIIFAPIVVLLGGAKLGLFDGIDLSWLDQLPELAVLGVFALVPLVPLVGMLLSCWISCRIYARKEF